MIYNNNSEKAIMACEKARTGNYGEDYYNDGYECNDSTRIPLKYLSEELQDYIAKRRFYED